jgi:hypothetical protein
VAVLAALSECPYVKVLIHIYIWQHCQDRQTLSLADLPLERGGLEGRKHALANGLKFGPKRKLSEYQRKEAITRRDAGVETLAQIAHSYGVHTSNFAALICN